VLLAGSAAQFWSFAADTVLQSPQGFHPLDGLGGDVRDAADVQLVKIASQMRPTGGERHRAAEPIRRRELVVGLVPVDLQKAREAGEMPVWTRAGATVLEAVGYHGWPDAAEGPIIARISP